MPTPECDVCNNIDPDCANCEQLKPSPVPEEAVMAAAKLIWARSQRGGGAATWDQCAGGEYQRRLIADTRAMLEAAYPATIAAATARLQEVCRRVLDTDDIAAAIRVIEAMSEGAFPE